MSRIVTVVYEDGVLKPLDPLHLRERETLRVQILPDSIELETQSVLQQLANEGILTLPIRRQSIAPMSTEERLELANTLSQASPKPLSEIIVEERGER